MIQIDIVLKSHYWYSTMGVQYIFCPRALFHRNVKQGFCVQEPAECSGMGCFGFSSYSAEIWLSHENVSQYCWGLLHRAKEGWRLHCNTPLATCWVTACSLHYKALMHSATEINLIFSSEVKSGVRLNHCQCTGEQNLGNTFAGTLCKSKMWHQAAKLVRMEPWCQVSAHFLHWPWEDDRDQKVCGLRQSQAWFLGC